MKVIVRYVNVDAVFEYLHVAAVNLQAPGVYLLHNTNGDLIASIPLANVRCIEIPENDTNLTLATQIVTK